MTYYTKISTSQQGETFVADNAFMLEHFYRGQWVRGGTPEGEPRLLASSAGVKPEQVAEAIQLALIPPQPDSERGGVALVRGKGGVFYFVQARIGAAGEHITHVVLLPSELIRTLSGNLQALLPLIQPTMPTYDSAGSILALLPFTADPPAAPQQTSAMLALMSATRDRIGTIETLLAAVITGTPLLIQGAPPELETRLTAIEGIMALLPPPARSGVTFATHAAPPRRAETAITFYPDGETPEGALVYRWNEPNVAGEKPTDDYARYITSQLRLDTALVLEQTNALTPVAGWRIRRGDSLGEALRYAAMRLRIDNAVLGNQPVELDDAAQVLADDPTLTDELRLAYVNHLLKLALPLEALDHLRALGRIARGNPDLENVLLGQIEEALNANVHAGAIYRALVDWVATGTGFTGMFWTEQIQRAAKLYADALVKAGDTAALATFLREAAAAPASAQVAPTLPTLLEKALPLASEDGTLAQAVLMLAAVAYASDRLLRLFAERSLVAKLPLSIARFQPYVLGAGKGESTQVLANAAGALGDEARDVLAIRFAELAILQDQPQLVDAAALELLAHAAASEWGDPFDQTLRWVVRNLATEPSLRILGEEGARSLMRILLARRAYNDFAASLTTFGRALYIGEGGQASLGDFTRAIFSNLSLDAAATLAALRALAANGLKPLPMMNAYYGALQADHWSPALSAAAADLNTLVLNNQLLASQLPVPMLLALVQYHVKRADPPSAVRVAELLPEIAAKDGDGGSNAMLRLCGLLRDDEAMRAVAVNLVRRYVRLLPLSVDRRAAARLSEKLGVKVRSALDATLLLKRIFDGLPIEEYAGYLHVTAQFLSDTASAYVDKERQPGIKILLSDLDSLNGGFTPDNRRALSREIIELGRGIVTIAARHKTLRPRTTDAQIDQLVAGELDASAPLDVMRIMGGYFSRGKRVNSRIEQTMGGHPLAARPAGDVLTHTEVALRLLRAFAKALPNEGRWTVSAAALRDELESVWEDVPLGERRQMVQDLARDFQRLPELILFIAERGNPRVLQEDERGARKLDLGEKKPESTLEFYRLVSGYFRARAR
jgi:hypothetical protein